MSISLSTLPAYVLIRVQEYALILDLLSNAGYYRANVSHPFIDIIYFIRTKTISSNSLLRCHFTDIVPIISTPPYLQIYVQPIQPIHRTRLENGERIR